MGDVHLISIVLASIFLGLFLGLHLQEFKVDLIFFSTQCSSDSDCSWVITNCCPEQAGAKWECINLKIYKQEKCPEQVICPQVISPKPEKACVCKGGSCVIA